MATSSAFVTLTAPFILASSSPARRQLLTQVGLPFTWQASPFDEDAAKPGFADLPMDAQAQQLAAGKALAVSVAQPEALVLAADQIAAFEGEALFKPGTPEANVAVLSRLSGKTHHQHSAACLYYQGKCVQTFHECIALTMRDLRQDEIQAYVRADQPMQCCAGYRFEGLGKWLFAEVHGSTEGVMGLPLQPILRYLCQAGWTVFWPK